MANSIVDNNNIKNLLAGKPDGQRGGFHPTEAAQANQDKLANLHRVPFAEDDAVFEPTAQGRQAAAVMARAESAYQYSETMSLQLKTREGDVVTVDFRQLYAQYQSYSELKAGEQGPQGVRYFESREALEATHFEEHLGFSVQGDLNDEELQAIFKVFEQVDELANQFFSGNIEQAFQKAIELDVDFSQLGSVNLNLTQTEMRAVQYQQAAMAEYDKIQQQQAEQSAEERAQQHGVELSQIPAYLQKWQEALETLDQQFENGAEALDEMVASVAAQRFPEQDSKPGWLERVKAFHAELAELAAQRQPAQTEPDAAIEGVAQNLDGSEPK